MPSQSRMLGRVDVRMQGDVVIALSTVPGRGWMMGAVSARSAKGEYSIVFADGSEEKNIRYDAAADIPW